MSNIPLDDALLLMNVIKAASEHGNTASSIGAVAAKELAEINAAAAEELSKASESKAAKEAEAAGQTGNTDLGADEPKREYTAEELPPEGRRV